MSRARRPAAAFVPMFLALVAGLAGGPPPATAGASGFAYSDDGEGFTYALISPGSNTTFGDMDDGAHERLQRILETTDREVLWFALDRRDYVTHDPRAVERVRRILQPVHELGREQRALGARQRELGREQRQLGGEQRELGRQQRQLASRSASAGWQSHSGRSAVERERAEIGRRQAALGREQAALGEAQRELGEQQRRLGERQRDASRRARVEIRRLAAEWVSSGVARPAREHESQ